MKNKIKKIITFLELLSNPQKMIILHEKEKNSAEKEANLYKEFYKDFNSFNALANEKQKASNNYLYPCLYDKTETTVLDPTYFYQDSWAFERIFNNKPVKHFDIGSHNKFVAHLSKIVDLTMVDIRPLSLPMDSINFIKGSILELPFEDESIESLSSLCVIEHIGLGRYGDPIDPDGSLKAFKEIDRVLCQNADFLLSVPVEKESKIYFNAHRAFNEEELLNIILNKYTILDKKYIYGNNFQSKLENKFGIGLYHLKKN